MRAKERRTFQTEAKENKDPENAEGSSPQEITGTPCVTNSLLISMEIMKIILIH